MSMSTGYSAHLEVVDTLEALAQQFVIPPFEHQPAVAQILGQVPGNLIEAEVLDALLAEVGVELLPLLGRDAEPS